ncbi:hypothetical protein WG902_06360 [Ramlibacter sp. PS3R-8]|uniref:hypothetical protein n=1 Tax=Ramlibacter sp. PS3R-8 TaxID=3133437 RepID=UPI0030B00922
MNVTTHPLAQRRAALAVHAMSPVDRDWLLSELPSAHRSLLQPLLAELEAIGIPPDPALLRDATLPQPPVAAAAADSAQESALSAGSARSLARWLRLQPPQVSARLIAARPDWRAPLLRTLPRGDRSSLETLAASLSRAPELERLVIAEARRQLVVDAASSPWDLLRRWTWRIFRRENG